MLNLARFALRCRYRYGSAGRLEFPRVRISEFPNRAIAAVGMGNASGMRQVHFHSVFCRSAALLVSLVSVRAACSVPFALCRLRACVWVCGL